MFWKFGIAAPSPIYTLLESEDVSLQAILDQDDVLQECRSRNHDLIEYLSQPKNVEALLRLVVEEPSTEIEETIRFKHPATAAEIISCDIPQILDQLAESQSMLDTVMDFVETEHELNPLMASFVSKTLGILVAKKPEKIWERMKVKDKFLQNLVRHLGTSAVMDLLFRFLCGIEGELRDPITEWLIGQNLLNQIAMLFAPGTNPNQASNAAQLLCDIIESNRARWLQDYKNQEELKPEANMKLLDAVESLEFAQVLLDHMFGTSEVKVEGQREESMATEKSEGESEAAGEKQTSGEKQTAEEEENTKLVRDGKLEVPIVSGISVILSLLSPKTLEEQSGGMQCSDDFGSPSDSRTSDTNGVLRYPSERSAAMVTALIPRLREFHQMLTHPPKVLPMPTTHGVLNPPLGKRRLTIAKLFATLVWRHEKQIDEEVAQLGTVNTLLSLFFEYEWNNFLHTQVESLVYLILRPQPSSISRHPTTMRNGAIESIGNGNRNTDDSKSSAQSQEKRVTNLESVPLFRHLFEGCSLMEKIVAKWKQNDDKKGLKGSRRAGFMGHLTKIALEVSSFLPPETEKDEGIDVKEEQAEEDQPDPRTVFLREHVACLSPEVRASWNDLVTVTLPAIQNKKYSISAAAAIASRHNSEADHSVDPVAQSNLFQQAIMDFRARSSVNFSTEYDSDNADSDQGFGLIEPGNSDVSFRQLAFERFEQQLGMRPMHPAMTSSKDSSSPSKILNQNPFAPSNLLIEYEDDEDEAEDREMITKSSNSESELWNRKEDSATDLSTGTGQWPVQAVNERLESSPIEPVPMEVDTPEGTPVGPTPTAQGEGMKEETMDTTQTAIVTPSALPPTNPFVELLQASEATTVVAQPAESSAPQEWVEGGWASFEGATSAAAPARTAQSLPPAAAKYVVSDEPWTPEASGGEGDAAGEASARVQPEDLSTSATRESTAVVSASSPLPGGGNPAERREGGGDASSSSSSAPAEQQGEEVTDSASADSDTSEASSSKLESPPAQESPSESVPAPANAPSPPVKQENGPLSDK